VTGSLHMLRAYVQRFLGHVFQPRLTTRDVIAFLFGLAVPLALWFVADEFIQFPADRVWPELLVGLALVVLMRAIAAPYDMWRELLTHVSELHRELDDKGA
jgi:hypothetical protein